MIICYDTKQGIQEMIGTVDRFTKLVECRRDAYVEKQSNPMRPDLNVFIVKKKWVLDQFGQVGYISDFHSETYTDITETVRPELSDVMTLLEFRQVLLKHKAGYTTVSDGRGPLPIAHTKCACCGKSWTMDNLDDYKTDYGSVSADELKNNVNQTVYNDVFSMLAATDIFKFASSPISVIQNELNKLTGRTWKIIQKEGKITRFLYTTHYHSACHLKLVEDNTKSDIVEAIESTEFIISGMIRTKNRYGSEIYNGPWWMVDTQYGLLRIGWRKRVIEISYEFIDRHYLPNTEETRGPGYEHVYGYEKLSQALNAFKNHLDTKADFKINIPNLTSHQDDRK